ncbi:hypothetical protein [Burkholderia vietnamiensis]|uniref:hypothetical protein n=1 Tax=Burkholderia vietnamiensis TaxID=60552 RepID=UPI001CF1D3C8|nr:hypothetical protein [Burkholderia vietnamiensis]MCA8198495.1 hypothetical protein [Burkholderia vietnamiensis]MCA8228342.1 hypothetical protein [Burkholderia vietnamiensis]
MTNVIQLRSNGADDTEALPPQAQALLTRYGVSQKDLREAIRPLFFLMHDRGIGNIALTRDGTRLMITVDGKAVG